MKQEEKEQLLVDLCSRLPYGVKVQAFDYDGIETVETLYQIDSDGYTSTIECDTLKHTHKPYLFPLSSMSEEQMYELREMFGFEIEFGDVLIELSTFYRSRLGYLEMDALFEWLNKNHFDYRGLIHKGLAIDATNLNIY